MYFLAASDETLGGDIFHHAGYVAPASCWNDTVVPAWTEYVLNGPPRIAEFHVTELRSRSWREAHGITERDADSRIDAATNLISQTKGLFAVRSSIDNSHYKKHASNLKFKLNAPRRSPAEFEIDYPSFLGYIYIVLSVCATYPKAEKVDFVIERKREVLPAIRDFYDGLRESFTNIGLSRFAEIMGDLIASDKKEIPLQLADLLCWHTQRHAASARNRAIAFSEADAQRLTKITQLGSGLTWPHQIIEELCSGLFDDWKNLNKTSHP